MATRRSIVAMTIPLDIQQEEEGKPKVQESREKLINDIFDMYDLDRDGKIKSSEVRELFIKLKPSGLSKPRILAISCKTSRSASSVAKRFPEYSPELILSLRSRILPNKAD